MIIRKWFALRTNDIALVQFIIEGYEGMATVSTIDSKAAIIQVLIMRDFMKDILELLEDLKRRFNLKEVPPGEIQGYIC